MDRFTDLLTQLGELLDTDLRPDVHGVCKLNINEQFNIQLEYDGSKERLLLAAFLCDIPPGKFRENLLKDALKANWPYPKEGTLCYSDRNNKLSLFKYISTINLTGAVLLNALNQFIDQAESWRKAVESGQTSHLVPSSKKSSGNIFGMK